MGAGQEQGINQARAEAKEGVDAAIAVFRNAAEAIDKALSIALTKNLIQKAISINRVIENENRVIELEKILNNFLEKERQTKIQEKIKLAEEEEKKGNFKNAIHCFEDAIKIEPKNSTLKKMVDLCVRIKRPDLVEKLTNWFLELQKKIQEKEKIQAKEAFEMSKKKHGLSTMLFFIFKV